MCESVEKLCEQLLYYPMGEEDEKINEILNKLQDPNNIKLAILPLSKSLEKDKRLYYEIMAIAKVNPTGKSHFLSLYNKIEECKNSKCLSDKENNNIKAVLLNLYRIDYEYEKSEKIAKELEKIDDLTFEVVCYLSEFYILTRRYDKADEILNKGLDLFEDKVLVDKINELLEDSYKRRNKKKKEYLPVKKCMEKYLNFMKSIDMEIIFKSKAKVDRSNEIPKEDYPVLVEIKNSNFDTFISVDIETTGFAMYDEIIEIGAVKVVNGEIVDEYSKLVKTTRKLSDEIVELTGITQKMLEDGVELKEAIESFMDFAKDYVLLGHNIVKFDSKYIRRAGRINGIVINNPFFDVMDYSHKINLEKRIFKSKKLGDVCEGLGIENNSAHRALSDAKATAIVYLELLKLDNKEESLDDMLSDMDDWL